MNIASSFVDDRQCYQIVFLSLEDGVLLVVSYPGDDNIPVHYVFDMCYGPSKYLV
jgi:hypothetical protein